MNNVFKKSAIALIIATLCASCDVLPELEARREKLLQQLAQCPVNNTQENDAPKSPNECQSPLMEELTYVENIIYKEKYGKNYTQLTPYANGYWIAQKDTGIGFLDPNGQEIVAAQYNDWAKLRLSTSAEYPDFVLDTNEYYEDSHFYKKYFPIIYLKNSEENWGAINLETGKEVIPFKYSMPTPENRYLVLAENNTQNKIIVNHQGKIIFKSDLYDTYKILKDNAIQATKGEKSFLLINQKEITEFNEGDTFKVFGDIIAINKNNPDTLQLYSLDGKLIYKTNQRAFIRKLPNTESIIGIQIIPDKYQLITKEGNLLFDNLANISNLDVPYFRIRKDNKSAIIDLDGNVKLDFKYDTISHLYDKDNNYVWVFSENKKQGIIDKNFNVIVPAIYDIIPGMTEGRITVYKNNKEGLLSVKGDVILDAIYDDIYYGFPNYLQVEKNGKIALFSKDGKAITPFKYEKPIATIYYKNEEDEKLFPNEAYLTQENGKMGLIDKNRKEIIPFKYQELKYFYGDLFKVKLNDKYGIMRLNGDIITQPQFDEITALLNDYFSVNLNGKWGIFYLKDNKLITEAKFDSINSIDINKDPIEFDVSWHNFDFSIKNDGSYPEVYYARQQDNKTLFNFELPPKVEISETISAQGKSDFQKLTQYLEQSAEFLRKKDQEFTGLPEAEYFEEYRKMLDYQGAEGERIAALELKDPEVTYLANLYLNATYMRIQNNAIFLDGLQALFGLDKPLISNPEAYQNSSARNVYNKISRTLSERNRTLYRLGEEAIQNKINYADPASIAAAEQVDYFEKLKQKYQGK